MPTFTLFAKNQLKDILERIQDAVYSVVGDLQTIAWRTPEPAPFARRRAGKKMRLKPGDKWGDVFDCAWFHFRGVVPKSAAGKRVVLLIDVNGEMCVVDGKGNPVQGLTTASSGFDFALGRAGKRVLPFAAKAGGGERIDVWGDAGCNDLFGRLQGDGTLREAAVAVCDDDMRGLFYDFEVLLDLLGVLPENSARHEQALAALNDAAHALREYTPDEARRARRILAPMLAQKGGDPSLTISAVGHAHIDLAWLWPIRETIRKGARTFATVLRLMEKYPDYIFGASQPQLLQWMKTHYPALYARIRQQARAGRFEPQGAMWVEADMNVTGGESLVRQLLFGKRFFKQEFGVDIRHLWLPDVFGYNAALPQIMKLAGVDYFMTQKLSCNLVNRFPHHSFFWQGIDGSRVLAHMPPEDTYNSPALPRSLRKIEQNYQDKGVSNRALMLFGIGDGGGGPGEEHLERLARIKNMAGLCPVVQEPAVEFFRKWSRDPGRFPTWVGELYFERHQGTLTTEARNKWYNRKMEIALREWEWTSILAGALAGSAYPSVRLAEIWKETLLYQFHDILPGSSIKRVYDESLERYRVLHAEARARIAANLARIAGRADAAGMRRPVAVFNSLAWERSEWIRARGRWLRVTVPSMGYAVVDAARRGAPEPAPMTAGPRLLENDLLRVRFHRDGSIVSIVDKEAGREVLAGGRKANRLAVYRDDGDAWDFPMDYAARPPCHMRLVASKARVDGPRAVLKQTYVLGHSSLVQEIALTAGSRRLDFVNKLKWREIRSMLRTSFPVAVQTENAACEIQFGHVRRPTHRNTLWDLAKDEVAGHKWVDLSQGDYGVALLNDSKYGYKVKDGALDLNLLRSAPYPGSVVVADRDIKPGQPHHGYTDQCEHEFSYALYPHIGALEQGRVVQAAYALNVPLLTAPVRPVKGSLPRAAGFLTISAPSVLIEAVKQAEDGRGLIVRLYEAYGAGVKATLTSGLPLASAAAVDLLEAHGAPLRLVGNSVTLDFHPFEIKTLRLIISE